MRTITDTLICDWCGKTQTTTYTHTGTDRVIEKQALRPPDGNYTTTYPDNAFFQIRSTQFICGKCLSSARALARPV